MISADRLGIEFEVARDVIKSANFADFILSQSTLNSNSESLTDKIWLLNNFLFFYFFQGPFLMAT